MTAPASAGALDTRITLVFPALPLVDAMGGGPGSDGDSLQLWAAIAMGRDQPGEARDQVMTAEQMTATVRWRSDITRDCALEWRGQRWRILSIADPDGARLWLRLSCARDI